MPTDEPTDDPTDETAGVARAYYDAWTNRKGPDALREMNVKIAEHLIVRDGKLVASEVVVDGAAFMAFMAG